MPSKTAAADSSGVTPEEDPPTERPRGRPSLRKHDLIRPLAVFAASRVLLLLVMVAADTILRATGRKATTDVIGPAPPRPHGLVFRIAGQWDGAWYQQIAHSGYGSLSSAAGDSPSQAFFPAYPLLVRLVARLTSVPVGVVGPVITLVGGGVAVVLLWALTRELFDRSAADVAAALFSFAPGSYVLSMGYSEGVSLAASLACLLALQRRQWLLAGTAAAAAGAAHSIAVGAVLACLVASIVAIVRRREWRSLTAAVVAPVGLVAWFGWLWAGSGSPTRWNDVERDAWQSGLDVARPVRTAVALFRHPDGVAAYGVISQNALADTVGLVILLAGLVLVVRCRLPAPLVAYSFYVAAIATFGLGSRPRMVLTAVPILIAAAAALPARVVPVLVGCSAVLMTMFALLSWSVSSATP